MQCSECGSEIASGAAFCPACGNPVKFAPTAGAPPVQINTWLVPAILATIFCCLPFGIVSIVFASRANSDIGVGNYHQAQMNADKARTWFWVAFGVGIVSTIFWVIVQVLIAAAD